MAVFDTTFPHKRKYKAEWVSPYHTTQNEIDHICITKTFRKSMDKAGEKSGSGIAPDHHRVVAKRKPKLTKRWITVQTALQRFNTALLSHKNKPIQDDSTSRPRTHNIYSRRRNYDGSNWKGIKEALTSTCQEVVSCKRHHHKE
ncbi:unnamed protein product [Schistosoma curassoni]|uniref:Reverse transcriptase domain-containing protein n=1 Tax=Schistosoma curassoni TaxID=6186 RepID=A0A183JI24_9TREM|nr:unnamed protein product [Schistosoma curassoni]